MARKPVPRLARVSSIVTILGHEICIGISSTLVVPSSRVTTLGTPTTSRNEPGGMSTSSSPGNCERWLIEAPLLTALTWMLKMVAISRPPM